MILMKYITICNADDVASAMPQDKVGPFCRAAADCMLILDILRGHDPNDIAAQDVALPSPFDVDVSKLRLGVLPSIQNVSAEVFCGSPLQEQLWGCIYPARPCAIS